MKHLSFVGFLALALIVGMPSSASAGKTFSGSFVPPVGVTPKSTVTSPLIEASPAPVEALTANPQVVTNLNPVYPVAPAPNIAPTISVGTTVQSNAASVSNNGLSSPDPVVSAPAPAPVPAPAPTPVPTVGSYAGGTTQGYAPVAVQQPVAQPVAVAPVQSTTYKTFALIPESEMVQAPAKTVKAEEKKDASKSSRHYEASVRGIDANISLIGLLAAIAAVMAAVAGYREYEKRQKERELQKMQMAA